MLLAAWSVAVLEPGCGSVTASDPAPADVPAEAVDGQARGEFLSDIQHLLGEAVVSHEAGQRVVARRKWEGAVSLFRAHVLDAVRRNDARLAFDLEVRMGRLGAAVQRNGGRPLAAQRELDRLLEGVRPWVVEDPPAPGDAQAPADPSEPAEAAGPSPG